MVRMWWGSMEREKKDRLNHWDLLSDAKREEILTIMMWIWKEIADKMIFI